MDCDVDMCKIRKTFPPQPMEGSQIRAPTSRGFFDIILNRKVSKEAFLVYVLCLEFCKETKGFNGRNLNCLPCFL